MRRGLTIGITGGVGCGKSEVAGILRRLGVPVWEADEAAHRRLRKGTREHRAVLRKFGAAVADAGGRIDRAALARVVFRDAAARAALEAIVHPPVLREMKTWLRTAARRAPVAAAVVPLLFETGAQTAFDEVLCVAASRSTAIRRLGRRGLAAADARRRMAAQWPMSVKRRRADYVIENRGSRAELARKVRRWLADLRDRGDQHHD